MSPVLTLNFVWVLIVLPATRSKAKSFVWVVLPPMAFGTTNWTSKVLPIWLTGVLVIVSSTPFSFTVKETLPVDSFTCVCDALVRLQSVPVGLVGFVMLDL